MAILLDRRPVDEVVGSNFAIHLAAKASGTIEGHFRLGRPAAEPLGSGAVMTRWAWLALAFALYVLVLGGVVAGHGLSDPRRGGLRASVAFGAGA